MQTMVNVLTATTVHAYQTMWIWERARMRSLWLGSAWLWKLLHVNLGLFVESVLRQLWHAFHLSVDKINHSFQRWAVMVALELVHTLFRNEFSEFNYSWLVYECNGFVLHVGCQFLFMVAVFDITQWIPSFYPHLIFNITQTNRRLDTHKNGISWKFNSSKIQEYSSVFILFGINKQKITIKLVSCLSVANNSSIFYWENWNYLVATNLWT